MTTYPNPHPPCSSSRVCYTKYLVSEAGDFRLAQEESPLAKTQQQAIPPTPLPPLLALGTTGVAVAGFIAVSVMVIEFLGIEPVERVGEDKVLKG